MKDYHSLADGELIRGLQMKRQEALAELYRRYGVAMKTIIQRILHDEAETDDLLAESLMEIWGHARDYSSRKGRPLAWMTTIIRRRAIDRLRKRDAYARAKDRYHAEIQEPFTVSSQKSAIREIIISDMRKYLNNILDHLPEAQKETLQLVYFQGFSQRQVAVKTHTPLGTVKTRLELGMTKMTAAMADSKARIW